MSLSLISEVWDALREHIDLNERKDAADTLVHFLIDNNYEADNIKEEFRDKDITSALKGYADQFTDEEEYEEDSDVDEWD